MYDLTIGLEYDRALDLSPRYRYDFVGIDYQNDYIYGFIFVFRTMKKGNGTGNVLIDLVHNSNINALQAHIHGDCHFHPFKFRMSMSNDSIKITDHISLEKVKNTTNDEYYALIKDQKYRLLNNASNQESKNVSFVRHLLFTEYNQHVENVDTLEFAPIFRLQQEHIWHNSKHSDYMNVSQLAKFDDSLKHSKEWQQAQKIILDKMEHLEKQKDEILTKLLKWNDLENSRLIES
ncbi:hypothetical protein COL26_31025 [Bacillus thuringiensis]|uniref:Uncharacterized protein n=1 Tax=Bacillus thuringiensis TaxID=1428 RepID=A0ABD6RZ42_BACTU|nr:MULTISPECIES: hypothetical protein [Bacillus]KXH87649.1 hypothetical protein AU379_27375 [Bacillus sp. JH7]KXY55892.1 hypothetical protein AT278_16895 [Bacillus cereus]PER38886.1 hypothetical protein CN495_34365 [Bacillus thuringiensis]PEU89796.1 hypothetical protein CN411_10395 [Bacillus thuringiensis]PFH98843.1 hypothetical protein COI79_33275 [Bacillus thuringiensis]